MLHIKIWHETLKLKSQNVYLYLLPKKVFVLFVYCCFDAQVAFWHCEQCQNATWAPNNNKHKQTNTDRWWSKQITQEKLSRQIVISATRLYWDTLSSNSKCFL